MIMQCYEIGFSAVIIQGHVIFSNYYTMPRDRFPALAVYWRGTESCADYALPGDGILFSDYALPRMGLSGVIMHFHEMRSSGVIARFLI
jgi:hypothetical protein